MLSLLACGAVSSLFTAQEEHSFVSWMRSTGNLFVGDEYHFRLGIYTANKRYIQEFNKNSEFKLGENPLIHLTDAEYNTMKGYRPMNVVDDATPIVLSNVAAPASVDYRSTGNVNPVKNQGTCGSCWAFGTIQSIESQWSIRHKQLFVLSEKNLVDCVTLCLGCHGCIPRIAMNHIKKYQNGRLMLEKDYPYQPSAGKCQFDMKKVSAVKVVGHSIQSHFNEDKLRDSIAQLGPAAVILDATHKSFQLYSGGIYDDKACTRVLIDHVVGVVGYGTAEFKDFWLIRNSWGNLWGEKGYMRLRRNYGNLCGIANEAMIPTVA